MKHAAYIVVFSLLLVNATAAFAAESAPEDSSCGSKNSDWCGEANDPCGEHKDALSCRQDLRCEALPFVGKALDKCDFDSRCFSKLCPPVGCLSSCESMDHDRCMQNSVRCELKEGKCIKSFPCPQKYNIRSGARA